jgi:ribulose-phosphate 3-epimerase
MSTATLPVLIAPSILSANFAALGADLQAIQSAGADWVHVDVMDGMFVPNLTLGPPIIAGIRACTALPFDVHLMIEQPERYLADYRNAGADWITVHTETCPHLHRTVAEIKRLGAKAGVSLNPSTPVGALQHVIDDLDLVLIMSVNPGFGGQRFIPQTVAKLTQLAQLIQQYRNPALPPVRISVDGGITPETAPLVLAAGANVLVAGSAVFKAPDKAVMIRTLRGH